MSPTRSFLTNEQKLRLREYWGAQPQLTHFEVADWVRAQFQINVSRSTLYRISQASDDAFTGSLTKKKTRRVKFPEFEKELLAYYLACQSTGGAGGVAANGDAANGHAMKAEPLTADTLVRKAVELRAKHGIPHDKLKLSNGWMHKFKERHCLKRTPTATGVVEVDASEHSPSEEEEEESKEETAEDTRTAGAMKAPTTSAASTPRRASRSGASGNAASTPSAMAPATPVSTTREPAVLPSPVALPAAPTVVQSPPSQCIQPLIHISAKSLSTVRSPGTLNWERTNHFSYQQASSTTDSHFAIVNNGIQILQDGVYQINVDLQRISRPDTITISPGSSSQEIFSVWNGTTRLDQCTSVLHSDAASGVALSVSEVQCFLASNACVRVDFKAPGHALHKSRIVVRLVS